MRFRKSRSSTALEVLAANGVETIIQEGGGFTPTPVISHAILSITAAATSRRRRHRHHPIAQSAGRWRLQIQSRPMEAPPIPKSPAGFRIAPTNCCAAATATSNACFAGVKAPPRISRISCTALCGRSAATSSNGCDSRRRPEDRRRPAGWLFPALLGADRGAYRLNLTVVNRQVDPRFAFMTVDHDGKIRMDCSSPYAMASLVKLKDDFDIAWGNDPDADRHGIVTRSGGLDESESLPRGGHRVSAGPSARVAATGVVGKTLVSSGMIDRVVGRPAAQALGSPGGIQMVRARPVRRHMLLRRRGERRRQFSPPRRRRLDHR